MPSSSPMTGTLDFFASELFHFNDTTWHFDSSIAVYFENVEEELIVQLFIHELVATHINFATYIGVNDHRLVKVFTNDIDKLVDICALKVCRIFDCV